MHENIILNFSLIILLGISAQWLGWKLRVPSILLLLLFGFLAGPITNILDPDHLFSDLLFPIVSLAVGLILFEGGLSLKFSQIKEIHRAVLNLISIGALITWILSSCAAYWILELGPSLSLLLGAILVVTGPTVIIPLLRHIRPTQRISSVARWEGIVIDPIGATLSVLIFGALLIEGWREATDYALLGFFKTIVLGIGVGGIAALLVVLLLRFYWIPDFLHTSFTLMIVVVSFAISNHLQEESGLLTVTVMGIILANQKKANVHHIVVFKETLTVLLISSLFILLAARMKLSDLVHIDVNAFLFVLCILFIIRPLAVFSSTWRTRLNFKERIFLAWLAPRGIIAAAVASIFSLKLEQLGFEKADKIVPITFFVIVATVVIYGLTAKPLANLLHLTDPNPQGLLIMGAHWWCRDLAKKLQSLGLQVDLIDRNLQKIFKARSRGISAWHTNAVKEDPEHIELSGIGSFLAMTGNDEANSLACLNYQEVFGRENVYQLVARKEDNSGAGRHLRGRILFSKEATFEYLDQSFKSGATIKATQLSTEFDHEDYQKHYGSSTIILFVVRKNGNIQMTLGEEEFRLSPGQTLISLVNPLS